MEHAHTGAVESVFRSAEVCVRHQLPSSPGHAEESVCPVGGPVFTQCNTHNEDSAGAAAGGAAAVSEGHTHHHIFVFMHLVVF